MPKLEDNKINKQILLDEVVAKLKHFSQLYGINSLFIVGGYCRSLYVNRLWEVNDIDVASAYASQSLELAGLFASEVLNVSPEFYERTGTAMVLYKSDLGQIKVEFQGQSPNAYMYNQEVRDWLHQHAIEDIPIMHNIYGRDFTINTMIYSLYNEHLYDLTDRAVQDFERKKIISLLPARLLIKYNPLAVLRAIRFSLTYDFKIDSELQDHIRNCYDQLVDTLSQDRILKEIVRILKIDGPDGLKLLKRFHMDKILLNPKIKEYVQLDADSDTYK